MYDCSLLQSFLLGEREPNYNLEASVIKGKKVRMGFGKQVAVFIDVTRILCPLLIFSVFALTLGKQLPLPPIPSDGKDGH